MKKILFIFLISLYLYYSGTINEYFLKIEAIKRINNKINIEESLRTAADYLDSLSSQSSDITEEIVNKLKDKVSYFDVKKAQSVTYEVRVTTIKDIKSSGTAVALTSDGKLITAYHNIAAHKSIQVINNTGQSYPVRVGKISSEHDLAYLHIDVMNIPYAQIAKETYLGQDIHMLSHDNLLLKGMVSQIKPNNIILNVEAKKGTSGGGVFSNTNELLSILISKDILNKTSTSIKPNVFKDITEKYRAKEDTQSVTNIYDANYCYNKNDLKVWGQHAKSKDLRIQELHALFKGLCNKVENRDLTAEEAQFIFESSRHRLLEENVIENEK